MAVSPQRVHPSTLFRSRATARDGLAPSMANAGGDSSARALLTILTECAATDDVSLALRRLVFWLQAWWQCDRVVLALAQQHSERCQVAIVSDQAAPDGRSELMRSMTAAADLVLPSHYPVHRHAKSVRLCCSAAVRWFVTLRRWRTFDKARRTWPNTSNCSERHRVEHWFAWQVASKPGSGDRGDACSRLE